jgi:signal peptidase I
VKRPRLRTILSTAAFLLVVAIVWWYFAPTAIGGSTRYVVTSGVSMEPRFHTGDLAIVRPAGQYKVGEIVAYWSTLLHTVVLHRIHAIHGHTYLFKGDNNDFIDPTRPTRADLLGKLWLHIPGGGKWLNALHSPVIAAVVCGLLATGLLFGFGEQQRRRKRRRKDAQGSVLRGNPLVSSSPHQRLSKRFNFTALITAVGVVAVVFAVLGAVSFTRPTSRTTVAATEYRQQVAFGYGARTVPGPVYTTGKVQTGDPIFITLVHELNVGVDYRFVSAAPHDITGTEKIILRLTSVSGWSHSMVLTPATHFTGDGTRTVVTLNIPHLQALLGRVSSLTGMLGSSFTIRVVPEVHITGNVAGHPLNTSFTPTMSFGFGGVQLIPQGVSSATSSAAAAGPAPTGATAATLTADRTGAFGTPGMAPTTITLLGVSPDVSFARWISLLGLLASAVAAAVLYLRKRSEPFEENAHIQSQYGYMIVPIVGGEDLGWPPVDVTSIKALVRLAESGQRLILHNRSDGVDTYMVNDEGTVYRYQVRPTNVVWGEWSETTTPVKAAA